MSLWILSLQPRLHRKGLKKTSCSVCQVLPLGHGWELESRGQVKGTAAQCSSIATCTDSQQPDLRSGLGCPHAPDSKAAKEAPKGSAAAGVELHPLTAPPPSCVLRFGSLLRGMYPDFCYERNKMLGKKNSHISVRGKESGYSFL